MRLTLHSPSINLADMALRRQAGVTLTDLLVGTTVGALVLIGISTTYVLGARATTQNVEQARLNQELRAVLEIMQQDLRRAGYWHYASLTAPNLQENPFQSTVNGVDHRLRTDKVSGEPSESCLLYSYDLDDSGAIGVCKRKKDAPCLVTGSHFDLPPYDQEAVEMFGFQLKDQAVRMRLGRKDGADTTFTCNSGRWERITSNDIRITTLQFMIQTKEVNLKAGKEGSACDTSELCRETRWIDILMTGQLRDDPDVRQSLRATVDVRNDRYFIK